MPDPRLPIAIIGGRVVDPASGRDEVADIVIEGGRVTQVGRGAAASAPQAERIDATGLIVSPGFVDLHVHLRTPGQSHKETIESGTAAAAAGGFTTIVQMPNTDPPFDRRKRVEDAVKRAAEEGVVRVLTAGTITRDREGRDLAPLNELAEAGAVAFSDDGDFVVNTELMRTGYERAAVLGLPISQHCELPQLTNSGVAHLGAVARQLGVPGSPSSSEDAAVARDLALAALTGGQAHIQHVSTAGAVALIRDAKERGVPVTAEVTPHHLVLTQHALLHALAGEQYNTDAKCNPPLREEHDVAACVAALADGTIDAIATDHAPHQPDEKARGLIEAPPGMIGLETAIPFVMSLVDNGYISLGAAIERLTLGPVRAWRLDAQLGLPGLGTLGVGAPGDVVLIDPSAQWVVSVDTLRSKSHNTPLLGEQVVGRAVATIVGGEVVHDIRDRGGDLG
ncbi:MAG: dihydroorotase [Chloroflexi bacterium]|nr:dihydroorotase [Chloroflexota bacterium]